MTFDFLMTFDDVKWSEITHLYTNNNNSIDLPKSHYSAHRLFKKLSNGCFRPMLVPLKFNKFSVKVSVLFFFLKKSVNKKYLKT